MRPLLLLALLLLAGCGPTQSDIDMQNAKVMEAQAKALDKALANESYQQGFKDGYSAARK